MQVPNPTTLVCTTRSTMAAAVSSVPSTATAQKESSQGMSVDASLARQWCVADVTGRQAVFNREDASAAHGDDESKDASTDAMVITVHDLSSGLAKKVAVKAGEKGSQIKARCTKLLGLAESASVFVFNGQILGDSTSVESIIAAGGHIAAAQSGVELVFDPEHMNPAVSLSDDRKEMWSDNPSYCSSNNKVRVTNPFPTSGKTQFVIQQAGSENGCYDRIGLVHEEYEAATETQLLGYDDATWAYEFGGYARHNRQSRYLNPPGYTQAKDLLHFELDADSGTLTVQCMRKDNFTSPEPVMVFDDLPTGKPFYLCVQVCGHQGRPRLRIIDDSSEPAV